MNPYPPRRRVWPFVALGIVGLVVVACAAGVAASSNTSPRTDSTSSAVDPVAPPPSGPRVVFGDGTWIVGTDIEPGTYRSSGAAPGLFELCSWTTRDGPSTNSDIINLGTSRADEPQVVDIGDDVKAFDTSGCADWIKQ